MLTPDFTTFCEQAAEHDFVPVHRRLLSDALTPVTAFRLLDDGGPACLFESVVGGEKVGRYSFLAVSPISRFRAFGNRIENDGKTSRLEDGEDPLDIFRTHFRSRVAHDDSLPPFIGGAIGYAAYDVVRYVEKLPHAPEDDRGLPDLDFAFYHTVCVFDHVDKTIWVVSLADVRDAHDANQRQRRYDEASRSVDDTIARLTRPIPIRAETLDMDPPRGQAEDRQPTPQSNFTRDAFEDAVRQCVQYIRAGDIFQVVPSQRFRKHADVDPIEVYRTLRVVNPSPFMFFLRTGSDGPGNCELIGCSPEIMCRVVEGVVTVRPLAGTRRRGRTEAEDQALEQELLADPKERAEHVMLVDLGRNDVGRVAKFGSVELTEIMVIERYSHVMHISSEVCGRLRDGLDAFDALKSALPAGTVSGAPKVRAMEIIDSIEPNRRGPYAGAVGYVDYRGNMDTCIALRTMVHRDGVYDVQAGCGVVADSDPAAEYEETLNKAAALLAAIDQTVRRVSPSEVSGD